MKGRLKEMLKRKMLFVDIFESDFKGNHYKVSRFVDIETLNIYSATNLDLDVEKGKVYICTLDYKKGKLVVSNVE